MSKSVQTIRKKSNSKQMPTETKKYRHSLVFGKSDLEDVSDSIWTPTIKDWRDVTEDYIAIAKKRRNNKFAMIKLQANLIEDIIRINTAIKNYRYLIEKPETRKEQFPNLEVSDKNIKYWETELKSHKIILAALKDIGDGIAWRLLDYNRSLIYNMCCNNSDGGPLVVNQGLINDINSLESYANNDDVINFVYHGTTNFLLIGDLTVKYSNGEINFVEIKSQKNQHGSSWKGRVQRQKDRAENLITIANEGVGNSSGLNIKIQEIAGVPNVCIKKLRSLLNTAKNSDVCSLNLSQYLTIVVDNFSLALGMENFKKKHETVFSNLRKSAKDKILPINSFSNFIFTPNKAPLSIHPFEPEVISNILMGRYLIWYYFNILEFFRQIEQYGWRVSNIIFDREQSDSEKSMFTVTKNHLNILVPPTLVARVLYEGLSIRSLIDLFEGDRKSATAGSNFGYMYEFEKEYELWD